MKIYSFSTVKNEEDIIESFVRYNMNIFDGMVISDNCSDDSTYDILCKLKDEGYNIDILKDTDSYFDQVIKRQELLEYTFKIHKPDYVFPLDADEFVSSYKNVNPRKIIEELDNNTFYKYALENFVITDDDDNEELFIPKRINNRRTMKSEEFCNYKCLISKEIYSDGIRLYMGSHSCADLNGKEIESVVCEDLFLAHYPIRSKFQIENKVITGRLNNLSLHSRDEGYGFHQYELLDIIIEDGKIPNDILNEMSLNYGISDKTSIRGIEVDPLNYSFCKNIDIKYYNSSNENLLIRTLKTSVSVINRMRDNDKKIEKKYCDIINRNDADYARVVEELNSIKNSKRWQMVDKLCKIFKRK